jgi:hypothetical protein
VSMFLFFLHPFNFYLFIYLFIFEVYLYLVMNFFSESDFR